MDVNQCVLSLLYYCPFSTRRLFRGESQFREERRYEDEDEDENEEKNRANKEF